MGRRERTGGVFLCVPALSTAASFVGTQTSPTEWTYTLTYDPLDNYAVCPTPGVATITLSGMADVTRATEPTLTDFENPSIDALNLQWIPQVSNNGSSVTWTHVGPGTGNFGVPKHVYGFKLYTAFPATSGSVNVASTGFSTDVSVTGPCPYQPTDSRDFTGTTQGPVFDIGQALERLHSAVDGVGPGQSLAAKVPPRSSIWHSASRSTPVQYSVVSSAKSRPRRGRAFRGPSRLR